MSYVEKFQHYPDDKSQPHQFTMRLPFARHINMARVPHPYAIVPSIHEAGPLIHDILMRPDSKRILIVDPDSSRLADKAYKNTTMYGRCHDIVEAFSLAHGLSDSERYASRRLALIMSAYLNQEDIASMERDALDHCKRVVHAGIAANLCPKKLDDTEKDGLFYRVITAESIADIGKIGQDIGMKPRRDGSVRGTDMMSAILSSTDHIVGSGHSYIAATKMTLASLVHDKFLPFMNSVNDSRDTPFNNAPLLDQSQLIDIHVTLFETVLRGFAKRASNAVAHGEDPLSSSLSPREQQKERTAFGNILRSTISSIPSQNHPALTRIINLGRQAIADLAVQIKKIKKDVSWLECKLSACHTITKLSEDDLRAMSKHKPSGIMLRFSSYGRTGDDKGLMAPYTHPTGAYVISGRCKPNDTAGPIWQAAIEDVFFCGRDPELLALHLGIDPCEHGTIAYIDTRPMGSHLVQMIPATRDNMSHMLSKQPAIKEFLSSHVDKDHQDIIREAMDERYDAHYAEWMEEMTARKDLPSRRTELLQHLIKESGRILSGGFKPEDATDQGVITPPMLAESHHHLEKCAGVLWARLHADLDIGCNQHFLGGVTGRDITSIINQVRHNESLPPLNRPMRVFGGREYLVSMPNRIDFEHVSMQDAIPITASEAFISQEDHEKVKLYTVNRPDEGRFDVILPDSWLK